jgi:hypothetical protein
MPLSVILESDRVESVKGTSVQGVNGVWINADVRVFIPLDVLSRANENSEDFYIPQEDAQMMFFDLEKLERVNPQKFNDWEREFIKSGTERVDQKLKFSKKQKAKIQTLHEKFSVEISKLKENEKPEEIPF